MAERNRIEYETELNRQKIDNIKANEQMDALKEFDAEFVSSFDVTSFLYTDELLTIDGLEFYISVLFTVFLFTKLCQLQPKI